MNRVQFLASSPRPLADVLTDALRADGNPSFRLQESQSDDVCDQRQYPLLPGEADKVAEDNSDRVMRPDEVAVTILLGCPSSDNLRQMAV